MMVSVRQRFGPGAAVLRWRELVKRGSLFLTRPTMFDYTATRATISRQSRARPSRR